MKYKINENIYLAEYQSDWNNLFLFEKQRLIRALRDRVSAIEHIGSTAIPGASAKPIIDIMVGVINIDKADEAILEIKNLGYEYLGEANVPERLYFRLRGKQDYNIALCQYQSNNWNNNILFRDYLINHQDAMQAYNQLKKDILASGIHSLIKYSQLKKTFIQTIIQKASVVIGVGDLDGKGVYANRNFNKGDIVIQYHLTELTEEQYQALPEKEKMFTHMHWGRIMLYSVPERYVNHSDHPNTYQDLVKQCDIALRDIKQGEMITGDATKDDIE